MSVLAGGVYTTLNPKVLQYVPAPVVEQGRSVLFGGDVMLDRNVARRAETRTEPLWHESVRALFAPERSDLRVVNLEGTITTNPSIARQNSSILRFTFAPAFAQQSLAALHISAVSLANNHALDFYNDGYSSTQEYLRAWGVQYFGHPLNTEGTLSTSFAVRGQRICLVGYHELFYVDPTSVVEEITRLRSECYRVVVMPHWGVEYEPTPSTRQQELAHAFIDAGADLVVGAHPHVVQTMEVYKGAAIFYSLGNFMFDQDFSWETTHGLLVHANFFNEKTVFALTPVSVLLSQAALAEGAERARVLQALVATSTPSELAAEVLEGGSFTLYR